MKSEKFLRLLSDIDSKYVEKARTDIELWQESQEGVKVEAAPVKPRRKMIVASAACAAAVLGGVAAVSLNVGNMRLGASPAQNGFGSPASSGESDVINTPAQTENTSTLWNGHPSELPQVTTALMRFDPDQVYDVLANGDTYLYTKDIPDERYTGEAVTIWMYDAGGEALLFLNCGVGRVRYTEQSDIQRYIFLSADPLYYSDPDIKHVDTLDGFSKEDAIQRVRDTAAKLGITNLGEPSVFAMNAENANSYFQYEKQLHEMGAEYKSDYDYVPWTKDDEAYYLTFPLMYGETPVPVETTRVALQKEVEGWGFDGAYVKAIVTKDKIVCFEGDNITASEYIYISGEPVKINFGKEDVLNKAKNDISANVPFSTKTEICGCELVYGPVDKLNNNEWVYAPMWRVDYADYRSWEDPVSEWAARYIVFYSAETGERIKFDWEQ